MKVQAFTAKGAKKEDRVLPKEFGQKVGLPLLAQALYVYESRAHVGLRKTKTRAEVERTSKKLYKQKGTGGARHGSKRAPIFVGGGVAHGPTGTQNYKEKMNKKSLNKALFSVLSLKLKEKRLFLLKEFSLEKTKEAFSFLQKLREHLSVKGKFSLVITKDEDLRRYFGNLSEVTVLNEESLNPYSLLRSDIIFLTGKSLVKLEERAAGTKKEKNRNEDKS